MYCFDISDLYLVKRDFYELDKFTSINVNTDSRAIATSNPVLV